MRVRATRTGFFGGVLREPGSINEEFVLDDPEKQFSAQWMVALDQPQPAPAPAPAKPVAAPKPEAEKL